MAKKRRFGPIHLRDRMEILEKKERKRKIKPVKNPQYAKMIIAVADDGFKGITSDELFKRVFGTVKDDYEKFYKKAILGSWISLFRRRYDIPFYRVEVKGKFIFKILTSGKEFDQVISRYEERKDSNARIVKELKEQKNKITERNEEIKSTIGLLKFWVNK